MRFPSYMVLGKLIVIPMRMDVWEDISGRLSRQCNNTKSPPETTTITSVTNKVNVLLRGE